MNTRDLYKIIFRKGTEESFEWKESETMLTQSHAEELVKEFWKQGYEAFVNSVQNIQMFGLPGEFSGYNKESFKGFAD